MRIFISRKLEESSPIRKLEAIHQISLTDESLIRIQPILLPKMPTSDWFFFYSKNGVACFTKQWTEKWKPKGDHQHIRWAAIGEGTAEAMAGWGITCDFVGEGTSHEIARQFLSCCKPSETVVFFRAFHSKNTLYELINEERNAQQVAIYDNQLIEKEFPPFDIGIFTSSRNAIAFLEMNPMPEKACIAMGQPTAETLRTLNIPEENIYVSEAPSESSLYDAVLKVLYMH